MKVLTLVKRQKSLLEKCGDLNMWNRIQNIYENYSYDRCVMIEPYILSEVQYTELWMQEKLKAIQLDNTAFGKVYELDEDVALTTEKGELVRSKSEKILADKLALMDIPYVYEVPLYLEVQKRCVHPDFIVLNKRTRKEYYWEHFGMMDNIEYCEAMIKKIGAYQREGIFQGKKLIVTFETQNYPITTKCIEEIIKVYLK